MNFIVIVKLRKMLAVRFDAHSSAAECSSLLGCDAVWLGEWTVFPSSYCSCSPEECC